MKKNLLASGYPSSHQHGIPLKSKKKKNLMTRFVSFFLNPLLKKQQARKIFFWSFHHTAVANPILKMRG